MNNQEREKEKKQGNDQSPKQRNQGQRGRRQGQESNNQGQSGREGNSGGGKGQRAQRQDNQGQNQGQSGRQGNQNQSAKGDSDPGRGSRDTEKSQMDHGIQGEQEHTPKK